MRSLESRVLIFVVAGCAVLYEMILASTLVLLYGDVVYYFSLTIAFFILFMGLGSALTRFLDRQGLRALLHVEAGISIAGALCPFVLLDLASRASTSAWVLPAAFVFCALLGLLSGMEMPLLFRALTERGEAAVKMGRLLLFDYFGSLAGSLLFALLLLPKFDLGGSALVAASINFLALLWVLGRQKATKGAQILSALAAFALLLFLASERASLNRDVESRLYSLGRGSEVVQSFRTRYQKVVIALTPPESIHFPGLWNARAEALKAFGARAEDRWISIWLNGFQQALAPFRGETDAYHHAFVHPSMAMARSRKHVLILGGGDGLPAKEVLKYPDVEEVVNVDLDGEWVAFTRDDPLMRAHTHEAFRDPRLKLVVSDAFQWVRQAVQRFDVILVDFPEGIDFPLARSYSTEFLKDLQHVLAEGGTISFQTDFWDNEVYWCAIATMMRAGYSVVPHRTLDNQGAEGLILLSREPLPLRELDRRLAKLPFVRRQLIAPTDELIAASNPATLVQKTAGLDTNTFFKPVFLKYYRAGFPEGIALGQ